MRHEIGTRPSEVEDEDVVEAPEAAETEDPVVELAAATTADGGDSLTMTMSAPWAGGSRISTCCPRETLSSLGLEDEKSWITQVLLSQPWKKDRD